MNAEETKYRERLKCICRHRYYTGDITTDELMDNIDAYTDTLARERVFEFITRGTTRFENDDRRKEFDAIYDTFLAEKTGR